MKMLTKNLKMEKQRERLEITGFKIFLEIYMYYFDWHELYFIAEQLC